MSNSENSNQSKWKYVVCGAIVTIGAFVLLPKVLDKVSAYLFSKQMSREFDFNFDYDDKTNFFDPQTLETENIKK